MKLLSRLERPSAQPFSPQLITRVMLTSSQSTEETRLNIFLLVWDDF